ncbi:hypothetical protein V7087_20515 [Neobacillus niacini]
MTFKQFREMERDVLRILLPDENGILPIDNACDEYYKTQLDDYDFDNID